ncbi:MAG: hypothetical protein Q4D11_04150, partial [Rhodospirillales bacterium]|nr:hypothetical protein [Rhodospirillales bacterium]
MTHRPLYAKKHHGRWVVLLIAVAAAYAIWKSFFVFDADKIIENSELKNKSFASDVAEIVAPKSGIK